MVINGKMDLIIVVPLFYRTYELSVTEANKVRT